MGGALWHGNQISREWKACGASQRMGLEDARKGANITTVARSKDKFKLQAALLQIKVSGFLQRDWCLSLFK